MEFPFDLTNIEFQWEGFGSKSFPKEPSLSQYTLLFIKLDGFQRFGTNLPQIFIYTSVF